jgi:hypothetical protein
MILQPSLAEHIIGNSGANQFGGSVPFVCDFVGDGVGITTGALEFGVGAFDGDFVGLTAKTGAVDTGLFVGVNVLIVFVGELLVGLGLVIGLRTTLSIVGMIVGGVGLPVGTTLSVGAGLLVGVRTTLSIVGLLVVEIT